MNIQPWHNNRIKLRVPEGKIDYINASPIVLTPSPRPATDSRPGQPREPDRYIAMQGPKASSIDHVWRMVVEQLESPSVIVMLTETHEGPMEKCAPYFPRSKEDSPLEINKRDEFGDGFRATVRCEGLEETPAGAAIELRKMVIQVHSRARSRVAENEGSIPGGRNSSASTPVEVDAIEKAHHDFDVEMKSPGGIVSGPTSQPPLSNGSTSTTSLIEEQGDPIILEERIVWHFLYKKWPDFGVPALADLESFFTLMRLSRGKNASPNNPRIVHCSAGVGRSGTFIALEHLIRELDAGVLEHYDERMATPARGSLEGPGGSVTTSPISASIVEEEGEDLIYSTVNQLREQRRTMVQAESQYIFIYQVLRKLWQDKYGQGSEAAGEPAAKRLEVDPFVEGS
ncbi:protein-tyrosine phosphatase-like protein [Lasiosphaeris hirsuta]|uniref:Protein-tyrosine phosphatase-like protein n=1 Tax=Lasiosphaeris hirsuta TaxID=260670 RepID=A0AA40B0J9_9PEZI|nr:protein-tyrosine phosphatase-like protein [Lasiosphaeris hirsuta]